MSFYPFAREKNYKRNAIGYNFFALFNISVKIIIHPACRRAEICCKEYIAFFGFLFFIFYFADGFIGG